jgi:hypothetical protein
MSEKNKVIKVIEVLIEQHERMYEGHKSSPSQFRDHILEADKKFIATLKEDLNSAYQELNIDDLYLKYKNQIILRQI